MSNNILRGNKSVVLLINDKGNLGHLVENVLEKGYKVFEISADKKENTELLKELFLSDYEMTGSDRSFLLNVNKSIEKNLENPDFRIEDIALHLGVSRSVLYKRIKLLTGLSPIQFVTKKRIEYVAKLFATGNYTITEISYKFGFSSPQYLFRVFKRIMGCTPKEYIQRLISES